MNTPLPQASGTPRTKPGSPQPAAEGVGAPAQIGFWASVTIAVASAAAWFAVIVFPGAPPRSGPNCAILDVACIEYPYTDAAQYVPDDFVWMVPAFLLGPLFVVLSVSLSIRAVGGAKVWARTGVFLAAMAATVLMLDYYVQFTTVQATLVRGELDGGLSILSQYNPHGVFIALEDLGYALILVSFITVGLGLGRASLLERILRRVLIIIGAVGAVAFPVLVGILGRDLEYWYELVGLSLTWAALIPVGILAALMFRREARKLERSLS